MSDELPGVSPGHETSEYRQARIAMWMTIAAAIVGAAADVLASLQSSFPQWGWIAGALSIVGVLGAVLSAAGYGKQRTAVKVAALMASAPNPPQP